MNLFLLQHKFSFFPIKMKPKQKLPALPLTIKKSGETPDFIVD